MDTTTPLFDSWLRTRLQQLYDETLDAPLPDQLLRLFREVEEFQRPR